MAHDSDRRVAVVPWQPEAAKEFHVCSFNRPRKVGVRDPSRSSSFAQVETFHQNVKMLFEVSKLCCTTNSNSASFLTAELRIVSDFGVEVSDTTCAFGARCSLLLRRVLEEALDGIHLICMSVFGLAPQRHGIRAPTTRQHRANAAPTTCCIYDIVRIGSARDRVRSRTPHQACRCSLILKWIRAANRWLFFLPLSPLNSLQFIVTTAF